MGLKGTRVFSSGGVQVFQLQRDVMWVKSTLSIAHGTPEWPSPSVFVQSCLIILACNGGVDVRFAERLVAIAMFKVEVQRDVTRDASSRPTLDDRGSCNVLQYTKFLAPIEIKNL